MKTQLVKTWMTANPICASPQTILPAALMLMQKHSIRRLPVLAAGRLVGIVTRGDLRGAQPSEATSLSIFEVNYLLGKLTLERMMTRAVLTVGPETSIGEAALLMLKRKIAGLVVVENEQVVGILTESDIFRMVVSEWQKEDERVLS